MRLSFFAIMTWSVLSLTCSPLDADDETSSAANAKKVKQIVAHRGSSVDRPECTLASCRRAIETGATAIEVDVRTSKDGYLVILHDATLDRTTNATGQINDRTLAELKKLDAGSWFDVRYKDERIPTLGEVLKLCKGKADVLLDLKEKGDEYTRKIIAEVQKSGDPKQIVIGVRGVEQAIKFRKRLPKSRQLGLIPKPKSIEAFAKAGVETIRLWPRWLTDKTLVRRVRQAGAKLHLNGTTGKTSEVIPLLKFGPDSMSSDDPDRLVKTLKQLARSNRTRQRAKS
jgi:glycerophosphoryl diester phosphodiesterase